MTKKGGAMMTEASKLSYKKWLGGIGQVSLDQELSNLQSVVDRNTDDSDIIRSVKEKIQVVLQEIQKRKGYSNVS